MTKNERLKIKLGVPETVQSRLQNASMSELTDRITLSVAVFPPELPPGVRTEAQIKDWLDKEFTSLVFRGWEVEAHVGPAAGLESAK